jgi:hypothetical protein
MRKVILPWIPLTMAILLCVPAAWSLRPVDVPQDELVGVEHLTPAANAKLPRRVPRYVYFENSGSGSVVLDPELSKPMASDDSGFRFPDDPAGTLLAKALSPAEMRPITERTTEPRPRPSSPRVEAPLLPLPPCHTDLPRVAIADSHTAQPPLVMEEVFFVTFAETLLPAVVALEAAARVRVPSVDVNKSIPLPILAKPSPDRAPLDDATIEASNAAALSGTVSARTKPAPFLKLTLPDPFENRKPVAPAVTPPEDVPNTMPSLPKR